MNEGRDLKSDKKPASAAADLYASNALGESDNLMREI